MLLVYNVQTSRHKEKRYANTNTNTKTEFGKFIEESRTVRIEDGPRLWTIHHVP